MSLAGMKGAREVENKKRTAQEPNEKKRLERAGRKKFAVK